MSNSTEKINEKIKDLETAIDEAFESQELTAEEASGLLRISAALKTFKQ